MVFSPLFFLALLVAASLLGHLPTAVAALYLGASAFAYLFYVLDKSAARRGARRIPESTLLVIGLLGGWPGALAAQNRLRHKNKKATFLFAFWITVVLNGAVLLAYIFRQALTSFMWGYQ